MTFDNLLDLALKKNGLIRHTPPGSRIFTAFDGANPVDCPTKEEFDRQKKGKRGGGKENRLTRNWHS